MIDIQNMNGYGIEDPGFALLREVAQKYCPEELQEARKEVIPDEVLDLSAIELLTPPPTPPLHGRGEPTGLGVAQSFPAGIGGQSAQPFPAGIGGQSAQPFPAPQGEGSGVGSVLLSLTIAFVVRKSCYKDTIFVPFSSYLHQTFMIV